jgi:hypothetical protein
MVTSAYKKYEQGEKHEMNDTLVFIGVKHYSITCAPTPAKRIWVSVLVWVVTVLSFLYVMLDPPLARAALRRRMEQMALLVDKVWTLVCAAAALLQRMCGKKRSRKRKNSG